MSFQGFDFSPEVILIDLQNNLAQAFENLAAGNLAKEKANLIEVRGDQSQKRQANALTSANRTIKSSQDIINTLLPQITTFQNQIELNKKTPTITPVLSSPGTGKNDPTQFIKDNPLIIGLAAILLIL